MEEVISQDQGKETDLENTAEEQSKEVVGEGDSYGIHRKREEERVGDRGKEQ